MGQVEQVRSHEVPIQETAERHHEAKPRPENRGNQMGVHGEDHSRQARLQGLDWSSKGVKRDKGYIRTECAHLIARPILHDALSSSSKRLGLQRVRCSVSVPPVRRHRETIAVADASQKIHLLGRSQGKCLLLLVRPTGREMLDVHGMSTARKCSRQLVSWSQGWNKAFNTCMDHLDLRLSCTHMFITSCLRSGKPPRNTRMFLQHLVRELHLKQQPGLVVYCRKTICRDGNHIKVTQTKSTMGLECLNLHLAGRTQESPVTNAEITAYRSVLGQLLWLGQQFSARPVRWCVSGCSETEQGDALRCQKR